jgi:hypothetical protein
MALFSVCKRLCDEDGGVAMTVIVCLDNANGMMFNHRRQSRDANVVKDILKTINGASLLIAPYSESLFSQAECSVSISESFLADADAKDYCFVENTSVAEFKEKISRLVIYKWNRDYPADFYFDIDYASDYKLETTLDFGGTSHEKITKEVYVR